MFKVTLLLGAAEDIALKWSNFFQKDRYMVLFMKNTWLNKIKQKQIIYKNKLEVIITGTGDSIVLLRMETKFFMVKVI